MLKLGGDTRLGLVVGQEEIVIGIPTDKKSVLPRHLGTIGTTGSGKSTTVAGLVRQLQRAGVATILIDVEGEYTEIDLPTGDRQMLTALKRRALAPGQAFYNISLDVGSPSIRTPLQGWWLCWLSRPCRSDARFATE